MSSTIHHRTPSVARHKAKWLLAFIRSSRCICYLRYRYRRTFKHRIILFSITHYADEDTRSRIRVKLDLLQLATTLDFATHSLQTLLEELATQLVKEFLESITVKVNEFGSINAAKVTSEVELENVVRTSNAKLKAQKSTISKHVKEVNEVKSAREILTTEIESLRSSSSESVAETQTLRQRIETLDEVKSEIVVATGARNSNVGAFYSVPPSN